MNHEKFQPGSIKPLVVGSGDQHASSAGSSVADVILSTDPGAQASQIPTAKSLPASQETTGLSSSSVITIGVGTVLSGPNMLFGWAEANSVQLAINETNASGGINVGGTTYTLALVSADDGCNPAQAVTATNALLDAGAIAVVGHGCSSASGAAQPIYYAAGVPMVSPSASAPQLNSTRL